MSKMDLALLNYGLFIADFGLIAACLKLRFGLITATPFGLITATPFGLITATLFGLIAATLFRKLKFFEVK